MIKILQLSFSFSQRHPWFQLSVTENTIIGTISDGQRFNSYLYGRFTLNNTIERGQKSCRITVLNRFESGTFYYAHIPVESKFRRKMQFVVSRDSYNQLNAYIQNLPYNDGLERKDSYYSYDELAKLIQSSQIQVAQLSCGFLQTNLLLQSEARNAFVLNFDNPHAIQIKFRNAVQSPVLLELQTFRRNFVFYLGIVANVSGKSSEITEDNIMQIGPRGVGFLQQWERIRTSQFVVWAGAIGGFDQKTGTRLQDMGSLLDFTESQSDKFQESEPAGNDSKDFEVYNFVEAQAEQKREYLSLSIQNFAYATPSLSFRQFDVKEDYDFLSQGGHSGLWFLVAGVMIAAVVSTILKFCCSKKQNGDLSEELEINEVEGELTKTD